jgi:2-dehydro-3-deoxyphosphogalactonate aldolase
MPLAAEARQLDLFPASSLGVAHLRALRDVLPADVRVWAVGSAGSANLRDWVTAGAAGIGVGAWLHATNQRDNN